MNSPIDISTRAPGKHPRGRRAMCELNKVLKARGLYGSIDGRKAGAEADFAEVIKLYEEFGFVFKVSPRSPLHPPPPLPFSSA